MTLTSFVITNYDSDVRCKANYDSDVSLFDFLKINYDLTLTLEP
jgi:hypothetical protein